MSMLTVEEINTVAKVLQDVVLKTVEYCCILNYSYEDTLDHVYTEAYSKTVLEVVHDRLGNSHFTAKMLEGTMNDYKRAGVIRSAYNTYSREVIQ